MKIKRIFLSILLVFQAILLFGQDSPSSLSEQDRSVVSEEKTSNTGETVSDEAGGTAHEAAAPADEEKEKEDVSLFKKTLPLDIDTASFYELTAWCRRLGIEPVGTAEVLRSKLYQHYELKKEPQAASSRGKQNKLIHIESADNIYHSKNEDPPETYIILEGNVVISVDDEGSKVEHRIKAARIIVNQTQSLLTATGGIEYSKKEGGKEPEVYTGNSLSFDISSSEGFFYDGLGKTTKTVEPGTLFDVTAPSTQVTYYFKGKRIARFENDTIILEDAIITSSPSLKYPNWKVEASKIWVLAPGEWATLNALLYIGEIPILPLPVFFIPGDSMFFNPVFGYKDREGFFLQTTTYLLGEKTKKAEDKSLSFFDVIEDEKGTTTYKTELNGLFLRKVKTNEPRKTKTNEYLKLFIDFYSRTGFYTGVESKWTESFSFIGGVALSRMVSKGGVSSYYNFLILNPEYTNFIENPYYFRYALSTDFSASPGGVKLSGKFESFSDPWFLDDADYSSRKEDMGLFDLIPRDGTSSTASGSKSSLKWFFNVAPGRIPLEILSPYLSTLNFSDIKTNLDWGVKDHDEVTNSDDRRSRFFAPSLLTAPDLKVTIAGTLLDSGAKPPAPEKKDPPDLSVIRSPFEKDTSSDSKEEEAFEEIIEEEILMVPPLKEKIALPNPDTDNLEYKIGYTFTPGYKIQTFYPDNWDNPGKINLFAADYSSTKLDSSGNIDFSLKLFGGLLEANNKLNFNSTAIGTWTDGIFTEDKNSKITLSQNTGFSLKPLMYMEYWDTSSISYKLDMNLLEYSYVEDPTEMTFRELTDEELITTHDVKVAANNTYFETPIAFSVTSKLPPLETEFLFSLSFPVWQIKNTFGWGIRIPDEGAKFDNTTWNTSISFPGMLNWNGTLKYGPPTDNPDGTLDFLDYSFNLKLWEIKDSGYFYSTDFKYNFEDKDMERWKSDMRFYNFSGSFVMEKIILREYDGGWKDKKIGDESIRNFIPSKLDLAFVFNVDTLYFWKNRISLDSRVNTTVGINFNEFTRSRFQIDFELALKIHKFLDFTFIAKSYNDNIYRYFPGIPEEVGVFKNPFTDLIQSYNFFNDNDRIASNFKVESLSINMIHKLDDWNITFGFLGDFQTDPGTSQKAFRPSLKIEVQWLPIPEIQQKTAYEEEKWNIFGADNNS